MNDTPIIDVDNARFRHPCCNYYVGLKPGAVVKMSDPDEIRALPGVLNVTAMCSEGAVIEDTNTLERICLRIHVVGATVEELAENLARISETLDVRSKEGEPMQLELLEFNRCVQAIREATSFG